MKEVFFAQAVKLIEKKEYHSSLDILFSLWKSTPEADVAEQILLAFRRAKQWNQYHKWMNIFSGRFKNETFFEMEKEKSQYEKNISALVHSTGALDIDRNAEKLFIENQITDQELVKIAYPLIRKAKFEKKWDIAEKWIDRINQDCLEWDESKNQSISQLRHYFLHKEDIYTSNNKFEKLIVVLKESLAIYPNTLVSKKSLIKAYVDSGNIESARVYIESNISWEHPNWFFIEQLAYVEYKSESYEMAWKYACIAFNTRSAQKNKVDLHLLISDIAEKLGKNELANDFKTLSILVRYEERTPLTSVLKKHIKQISNTDLSVALIVQKYREEIIDGINQNRKKCKGEIVWFPLDRNFARLKYDEHKSTIIFKSDLDSDCYYQGAKINFYLEETVDPKSGKKSKIGKFGTKVFKL